MTSDRVRTDAMETASTMFQMLVDMGASNFDEERNSRYQAAFGDMVNVVFRDHRLSDNQRMFLMASFLPMIGLGLVGKALEEQRPLKPLRHGYQMVGAFSYLLIETLKHYAKECGYTDEQIKKVEIATAIEGQQVSMILRNMTAVNYTPDDLEVIRQMRSPDGKASDNPSVG